MIGWLVAIVIVIVIENKKKARKAVSETQERDSTKETPEWVLSFFVAFRKIAVFAIASAFIGYNNTASIAFYLIATPFFFPTLLLNVIFLPLGLSGGAYWLVRLCVPLGVGHDRRAAGAVYGALALVRKGAKPHQWDELRWKVDCLVAGVAQSVAMGLLAALAGDELTARLIFLDTDTHAPGIGPRKLRRIARDWLVMDAAQRGNWSEAIRLGGRGWFGYRWSYSVGAMAKRLCHEPSGRPGWQLCALWLLAPRRWQSLSLLRRALKTPRQQVESPLPCSGDLPLALGTLAKLVDGSRRPTTEAFLATLDWVDSRLEDTEMHFHMEARTAHLDRLNEIEAGTVIEIFRDQLIAMIIPILENSPQLAKHGDAGGIVRQAINVFQPVAMQRIEVHCGDYDKRIERKRRLDHFSEWVAWAKLRDTADLLLQLAPWAKDAVFQTVYSPVNNFAAHQHNRENRLLLAHNMFTWLHKLSIEGSPQAISLSRNMNSFVVRG
jgi:hypothetical protein